MRAATGDSRGPAGWELADGVGIEGNHFSHGSSSCPKASDAKKSIAAAGRRSVMTGRVMKLGWSNERPPAARQPELEQNLDASGVYWTGSLRTVPGSWKAYAGECWRSRQRW